MPTNLVKVGEQIFNLDLLHRTYWNESSGELTLFFSADKGNEGVPLRGKQALALKEALEETALEIGS